MELSVSAAVASRDQADPEPLATSVDVGKACWPSAVIPSTADHYWVEDKSPATCRGSSPLTVSVSTI